MLIGSRRDRPPGWALAPVRLRQILWTILAPLSLGLLFFLGWSNLDRIEVPWPRSYLGTLRPANALIPIRLPADIPIKMVLVERGDLVEPGETLVVLDKVAMEARLKKVNRSLLAARVLRECFFNWQDELKAAVPQSTGDPDALDPEDRFSLRAAHRECSTVKSELQQAQSEIRQQQTGLRARLDLADGRLALALDLSGTANQPASLRAGRAYEALSIAQARSVLKQQLLQLDQDATALTLAMESKMLERARAVSAEVEILVEQHDRLLEYSENPRLHASEGGRIVRVRPTGQALVFGGDIILVEMEQTGAMEFIASVPLPIADAKALTVGQSVSIQALGLGHGQPVLSGTLQVLIAPDVPMGGRFVIAQMSLSEASTARLQDPRKGVALHGKETASVIRIDIANQHLNAVMWQSGLRAISSPAGRYQRALDWLFARPRTPNAF